MADGSEDTVELNGPNRSYALITGGYRNLGYVIARALKENDISPVITYRTDEERARTASETLDCPFFRADLTRYDEVVSLFETLDDRGIEVDILINNASSFHTGNLLSMNEREIRNAVEGCLYPAVFTTQIAAKRMKARGYGRIVNIGMAGISDPRGFRTVSVHAAAKTALLSLTLSYARELEPFGVTVNMVSPGMIDRSGYSDPDKNRIEYDGKDPIQPDDVAAAVVDLIGDGTINGVNREVGRDMFR